jgi:hypothetical protein
MKLIDERTLDGSRHFAHWPHAATWSAVYDHLLLLPSAEPVNVVGRQVAAAGLDFTFRGHRFTIHSHEGQFRLIVCDPQCSDLILYQVGRHFERLLGEGG